MITRYDPFREAMSLRRAMDQLFEQSVVNPGLLSGTSAMQMAPMDICETNAGYEIDVALPGVRPDDIELTVDQNTLTLRGQYSHQNEHHEQAQSQGRMQQPQSPQGQQPSQMQQPQSPQGQQPSQMQPSQMQQPQMQQPQMQPSQPSQMQQRLRHPQTNGHNWILRELPSGTFERTITLPKPIDPNGIETSFKEGILTIRVPVSEASRPRRISISGGLGQGQERTIDSGRQ
jgi:HSP20 family molecular chaperone IbpA